jgi:hypothetical protein
MNYAPPTTTLSDDARELSRFLCQRNRIEKSKTASITSSLDEVLSTSASICRGSKYAMMQKVRYASRSSQKHQTLSTGGLAIVEAEHQQ